VLRARIEAVVAGQKRCEHEMVGRELPALIRDLHTSVGAGRDVRELLAMGVLLHVQGSHAFLGGMGAPGDLCWQNATLARQLAREHGGAEMLGLATFGATNGLLAAGEFNEALAELDSVTVPTTPSRPNNSMACSRCPGRCWPLRTSAQRMSMPHWSTPTSWQTRTGEGNAYWLGFGPTNDPGGLFALHEAILSWRQARWLVRVRSSGWPFHHALSRIRLRATAA
jgi:hypothetical protein